jgi:hypothetical protein
MSFCSLSLPFLIATTSKSDVYVMSNFISMAAPQLVVIGLALVIHMPVGTRDLVVYYESSPTADFVVSRHGMKWVSGDPVEVTDDEFKLIHTTLRAWARARGSTLVGFDA